LDFVTMIMSRASKTRRLPDFSGSRGNAPSGRCRPLGTSYRLPGGYPQKLVKYAR
jgi:hypothetical protein